MSKQPRIEIARRPRQWLVRVFGKNGEELSSTQLLTTKADATTNMYAQAEAWRLWQEHEIRTQFVDERPGKRAKNVGDWTGTVKGPLWSYKHKAKRAKKASRGR